MTAAAALIAALECAQGRALIMQVGVRPQVITESGGPRDIGSTEVTAATLQTLVSELVDEATRVAIYRTRRAVVPLMTARGSSYVLTVDYVDSRFSLRVEREMMPVAE